MITLAGITDHGRVEKGINGTHRIEVESGDIYFVKPRRNTRTFCNEVIAAVIAPICRVPTCPPALIKLTEAFLDLTPDARADFGRAGIFFGTREETIDSLTLDDPDPHLAATKIENVPRVYDIVMFDELVANTDRKGNLGNILLVRVGDAEPAWEIRSIDHDAILTGPSWTISELHDNKDYALIQIETRLREWLQDKTALESSALRIQENIGRYRLTVRDAPVALSGAENESVGDFLEHRAGRLPQWVRDYFPYAIDHEFQG